MATSQILTRIAEVLAQPGQSIADFVKEWQLLSPAERQAIKAGFNDGSMTY